jgi:hypothetical protein
MAGASQELAEKAVAIRPVGFVTHFALGSYDELAKAPVIAELCDLIHWRLLDFDEANPQVENIVPDMAQAAEWLPILGESGRKGFPIIDTSMHHTMIPWRNAMTRELGEDMRDAAGNTRPFSSLHSPAFRASVNRYLDQMIAWFAEHDTQGSVPAYINGAEWFYPASLDFSPQAIAAFRDWLLAKYASLDALNAAWGAQFADWPAVDAPRFSPVGAWQAAEPTWTPDYILEAVMALDGLPVEAGQRYVISAEATGTGTAGEFAGLEVFWADANGTVTRIDAATAGEREPGSNLLEETVRAPAGAATARLRGSLWGPGTVMYRNPSMRELDTDKELASAKAEDWHLQSVSPDAQGTVTVENGGLVLRLEGTAGTPRFAHLSAALEDWTVFSHEAMAGWLDTCAQRIKRIDPTRPVSSYVGCVFGMQAMWDYGMMTQRLDISLANSSAIDINGIQMSIAGDDFTWATYLVDVARKYEKPIWGTDLVDFPYGHYSGFENIYRASLATVQHGIDGILWYCWRGVPDYSYFERLAEVDRNRLIRDTRSALDAVEGYAPVVRAAMLSPILAYSLADEGGQKGDMLDHGGLYHLLLDAGMAVDVVTPYEIARNAETLNHYEMLFLSDCPVLPKEVYAALAKFIANGGKLITSGRIPQVDLKGDALQPALEGTVISLSEKVGRPYWGRLHKAQVYGNTPAMLVEAPDPERTPESRRVLRQRLHDAVAEAGWVPPVVFADNLGATHAVPYHQVETGEWLLFLVHTDKGRSPQVSIQLNLGAAFTGGEAWCDFDRRHPVVITGDMLTVPDFSHACIVRLISDLGDLPE